MTDRHTRRKEKLEAQGLAKKTYIIPSDLHHHFTMLAKFCCDNRDYAPAMLRHKTKGRMKGFDI